MSRTSRVQRLIGASVLLSAVTFAITTCGTEKLLKPQPSSLARVSGDAQSGTAGAALANPVTVRVVDDGGTGIAGIAVQWSVVGGGGSVSPGTSTSDESGTASATWTLGVIAGPNSLGASLPTSAGISSVTFSATGLPGPAAQLVLTTAAAGAASGAAFTTQPVVALRDAHGNAVTTDNSTVVSMTVSSGATVVGTATVRAVAGVATFSGVGIGGTAGTAYTLTFASGTLTAATESITPTSGAATALVLTTGAAGAASGAAFGTQPVVTLKDGAGNIATADNTTVVTMTVSSGATVVGTATARAASGVATFTDVGINGTAGTAYTLTFASGTLTAVTSSITPTAGAASRLELATAAVGAASGASFTTQPVVFVKDGAGNRVTTDNSTVVTMVVSAGGTVVGTATATAANGVATFANVGISGTAGTVYTLTFGSGTLTAATQAITPSAGAANHVMVLTQAAGAASGAPFSTQPTVAICDAAHNIVTTDNSSLVTMTVSSGATVVGTATAKASSGVATFSGVGICGKAGRSYTLSFSSGVLTAGTHAIAPAAGAATKLGLTTAAAGAVSGAAFATQPVVEVQDAEGNTVTADNSTVVTMTVSSGAGVVGVAQVTASGGVAAFSGVGITGAAGTAYTLTFAGGSLTPVTQSIAPTPGAGSKLVMATPAAGAPSGAAFTTQPVVVLQDAQGNTVITDNSTVVTMTVSTGASVVGSASATVSSGVATFTGVGITGTAGTAYTLTFRSGALASATQPITPTVGPVATGTSTVSVWPSGPLVSGNSVTLTLQAKDAGGNNLTAGGLTVAFAPSTGAGVSTGTISATTDLGNGSYAATFTGVRAGSPTTIGATIGGSAVTTSLPTVEVKVGAVSTATSTVSVSSPTVGAGSNVTLTLQAKDLGGNNLTSGGLVVAFAHSGGTSTGAIGPTTDNGNGTYTATFTGGTAGTATTIHATIAGTNVTSSPLPAVTVTAASASTSTSTVRVSGNGTVASGSAVTLTLQSKDPNGNNLTSGGLTVLFNASAGAGVSTGTISATIDHGDGTYTATFTGVLVGTPATIGATIGGEAVTSTLPMVAVTPGEASASTSAVTVSSETVVAGSDVTLTLHAKDAAGNALTAGGLSVAFARSTGAGVSTGTIGPVTDRGNGTYTATFTGQTAGTATTIHATISETSVTSSPLPTVTVTVGGSTTATSIVTVASGAVVSGNAVLLTLQAKDAGGNNLTTGGLTVAFTASGGTGVSTGNIGPATDNGNGTYTATFTAVLAGTPTTIGATMDGAAVTSTLPTVTVTPGPATLDKSMVSVSSPAVQSGETVRLTLDAYDAAGNHLTSGGLAVAFTAAGGTSTGTIGSTTDNLNGTYTATFAAVLAGTETTIGAKIGGVAVTSSPLPTVTVNPGTPSATASTVSVSSATVESGSKVTLTVDAKDAAGNSLTSSTVEFSFSGGSSTGSIGATTNHGTGTYTAEFTGALAGSATTITATIDGVAVTGPTVTVTVGSASAATSTVTVASGTAVSGSSVLLTLQAMDATGNHLATGGLTVAFTQSPGAGVSTGTIGPATDNGNGTYTATFTAVLAGTPATIGATMGGAAVTSTLPTVTVTPGPADLAKSTVSVSPSPTVKSGEGVTLTLDAYDAAGNHLTSGGLAVAFTQATGVAVSTGTIGSTADNLNGTYTATFTGRKAGTATTIGATIGGVAVTWTPLPAVTVTPGVPSAGNSTVTPPGPITVISGESVTLTLHAKDAEGDSVPGELATVAFALATTGQGVSTGTFANLTENADGTYSADFTGVLAGTPATIEATMEGVTVTGPAVTVTLGPVSAATSTVTVASGTVVSGSSVLLTLHAKDAAGNDLTSGGLTVAFTASGGTSTGTVSGTTDNGNGTYTATFSARLAGTATTIHAAIGMTDVTSAPLPTVTVTPGPVSVDWSSVSASPATVTSGSTATLTLVAIDGFGNHLASGGLSVAFTASGGTSTGVISPTTDHNNGTYTATFTGGTAGTATTIHATINNLEADETATVAVTPGLVASVSTSTVSVSSGTVVAGSDVTLTLQGKDAAGNNLTAGGQTVVFTPSTGAGVSTGTISPVTSQGDGTYTATFTGALVGTPTTIGATIDGVAVISTLPTVTVTLGPVSVVTSTVSVSSPTVAAGSLVTLKLQAKDAAGNNLTSGGLSVAFTASGGTSYGDVSQTTDNGDGTYTATFAVYGAGTATTIGATVGGVAVTWSPLPTVTVTPGPVDLWNSMVSVSNQTVRSGEPVTLTLTAVDGNGNQLWSGGLAVAFTATGGTGTGDIGDVTDHGDGTYTATFTGGIAGATRINATISGSGVGPYANLTVTPGAPSALNSGVSISASTVPSGFTAYLTVQANDAAGNHVTGGTVAFALSTGVGVSTGQIGAVTEPDPGWYEAGFTGVVAGSPTTITATITSPTGGTATLTISVTVTLGPISPATSAVTASGSTVMAGSAVMVKLQLKDYGGNNLTTSGQAVLFSFAGGASTGTFEPVLDNGDGTYTATFTGMKAGTATTIHATINGVNVTSTPLPTVEVTLGPISPATSTVTVSADHVFYADYVTVTLQLKDPGGNDLTTSGQAVAFYNAGGTSTGTISAATDNLNGTYTATFTGTGIGTPTTIHARINGSEITSTLPTVEVTPGAPSPANSIVSVANTSLQLLFGTSTTTLTLQAKDAWDHNLTSGGLAVAFQITGSGSGDIGNVIDHGDGTYTADFTATGVGSVTVHATIGGVPVTTSLPTITISLF